MLAKKTARIFGLFLILMLACSMVLPMVAFAAPGDTIIDVSIPEGVGDDAVKNGIKQVNKKYAKDSTHKSEETVIWFKSSGVDLKVGELKSGSPDSFVIYEDEWNELRDKEKTKVLKEFVDGVKEIGDDDAVHTFITDINEQEESVGALMLPMIMEGTKADLYKAYKVVEPFLDVLNIVLGVGCVILILLLFASTVMDLAYIGLPVWRESQAAKGGSGKHPFGVSYEALTTVQEVEKGIGGGDGGYKNAYLLYFKRRALTYIILAICIMYLICGGISGIIAFVLSLTRGIV
jgi:hypothetical protein